MPGRKFFAPRKCWKQGTLKVGPEFYPYRLALTVCNDSSPHFQIANRVWPFSCCASRWLGFCFSREFTIGNRGTPSWRRQCLAVPLSFWL